MTEEMTRYGEQEVEVEEAMTAEEKARLKELERVIDRNTKQVFEWGVALMEIRGKRLYRETHATFEAYMRKRWDMGRNYANRLIAASQVMERLVTRVTILPESEAQVRPLIKLDPPLQLKAWEEVIETASGRKVTSRIVAKVVSRILGEKGEQRIRHAMRAAEAEITDASFLSPLHALMERFKNANQEGWKGVPKKALLRALDQLREMLINE